MGPCSCIAAVSEQLRFYCVFRVCNLPIKLLHLLYYIFQPMTGVLREAHGVETRDFPDI